MDSLRAEKSTTASASPGQALVEDLHRLALTGEAAPFIRARGICNTLAASQGGRAPNDDESLSLKTTGVPTLGRHFREAVQATRARARRTRPRWGELAIGNVPGMRDRGSPGSSGLDGVQGPSGLDGAR